MDGKEDLINIAEKRNEPAINYSEIIKRLMKAGLLEDKNGDRKFYRI